MGIFLGRLSGVGMEAFLGGGFERIELLFVDF